jgi:hypothetical protein
LDEWDDARERHEESIESTKSVAEAGYRVVHEIGKDFCSSESSAECSEHDEELTGTYTVEILDGCQDTESGTGRREV